MKRFRTAVLIVLFLATGGTLLAQVAPADNIPNWSVPSTWSPSRASGGIQTMTDVTDAIPFVAIAPCRIADTRAGQGFSGQAGPPGLTSFTNRSFQISGSPATLPAPPAGCPANAIPAGADAVSVQFTIVFPSSGGNLVAWQQGATQPVVSVINWDAGAVALGSGTIIPLNASNGQITVRLNTAAAGQGVQLVIDVNGYFSDELPTQQFFDIHGNYQNGTLAHFLNQAATTVTQGLWAETLSTTSGSSGLLGQAQGGSGYTFGVKGTTNSQSADSAGVKGVNGSGDPLGDTVDCTDCYTAGVRGAGFSGYGVLGMTEDTSVAAGVGGVFLGTDEIQLAIGYLGYSSTTGVRGEANITKSGTVSFTEPHPRDPNKMIQYASLEGPEAGTYFRGKGRFQNGIATIAVPEDFRIVSAPEGLSIQVTPIGQMATVAVMQIDLDRIVIRGSRNVEFFYTVNGIRIAQRDYTPIVDMKKEFVPAKPDQKMPAYYGEEFRRRLIANGTYREDGTVNMETAKRLGWDEVWAKREEAAQQPRNTATHDP